MDKIYKNLYKEISKYLDFDQVCEDPNYSFKKKIDSNKNLVIRLSKQKNEFFTILDFIFIDKKLQSNSYTEFIVRIWNNQMSEVIKYKGTQSFEYQNIYTNKYGVEIANKELQTRTNQILLDFLKRI